jgi:SHAQKYF class myb-like DNA-binding protein
MSDDEEMFLPPPMSLDGSGRINSQRQPLPEHDEDFQSNLAKRQRTDEDYEHDATDEEEGEEDGDWDEELHESFVGAVFEIGLKNASPAVILENMTQKLDSITSERVKSKLQKYRNSKEKSRQEFMEEYRSFLQRVNAMVSASSILHGRADISPSSLLDMIGSNKLLGGDLAGFLTYAVTRGHETSSVGDSEGAIFSARLLRKGAEEYVETFAGCPIPFPVLSDEEKTSSLGVAMAFVMGLFMSMSQHIARERARSDPHQREPAPIGTEERTTTNATTSSYTRLPEPPPQASAEALANTTPGQRQSRMFQSTLETDARGVAPFPVALTTSPFLDESSAVGSNVDNNVGIYGQSFDWNNLHGLQ